MIIERIKAWTPINFELAANPVNWIIVFLMVAIAGLAVSLIFHPANLTKTGD